MLLPPRSCGADSASQFACCELDCLHSLIGASVTGGLQVGRESASADGQGAFAGPSCVSARREAGRPPDLGLGDHQSARSVASGGTRLGGDFGGRANGRGVPPLGRSSVGPTVRLALEPNFIVPRGSGGRRRRSRMRFALRSTAGARSRSSRCCAARGARGVSGWKRCSEARCPSG